MQIREAKASKVIEVTKKGHLEINQQDEKGNTLLHSAAKAADVLRVRELIQQGADVNLQNKVGDTPLSVAAYYSNENNWAPLDPSATFGQSEQYTEIVKTLLEHRADPNIYEYESPLTSSVRAGNPKMFAMLLPVTTKKDLIGKKYPSILYSYPWYVDMMFCAAGQTESNAKTILTLLKEYGANFNEKDRSGEILLNSAVFRSRDRQNTNLLTFLLENGAEVNVANDQMKWTPLHIAANLGTVEAAKLLLKHGANTELTDKNGDTPSEIASQGRDIARIRSQHWSSDEARAKYMKPYEDVRDSIEVASAVAFRAERIKNHLPVNDWTKKLDKLGVQAKPTDSKVAVIYEKGIVLERNKVKKVKKKIKAKKVKHIKSSKGAAIVEPVSAPATDVKETPQKEDVVLAPEQKHVSAENIVWEGDVPAGHLIESTGGSVTINGKVGKGATVKSKYGLTINGDAEEKSILIAQNGVITLKHACDGVSIKSPNLFVKLQSVGNGVNIETDDDVRVEQNIGSHCTISSGRRVSAKTLGTHTAIKGKLGVTVDVISENTVISANEGKVNVRRVEECSTIFARYDVTIEEFAAESAYIEAGDRGNVLLNGKFRVNSPVAIANHIAISAGFELGKAVKNLSLGISSDKVATPADAKVKSSPSISESGADSKMNPKKEIDRSHYNSKPFLTTNLSYITADGEIRNISAHFYELLGQSGVLSNNIKTNIPFDMQRVLEVTWGDVKKSILLGDSPSVCDMNFYEEDFGKKTRIIKFTASASVDKKECYVPSASISPSVISSSQTSYLERPPQNYYSSSSPMMFSSREVKREEKGVLARPLKLPTAEELNKILGITGLVTEVREVKVEYIHDSMSISFDMGINTDLYEHILSEKLLAGISGVKLTKCSVFTRLNIPDDVETYNRFMRNVESALKHVNESTTTLKMGKGK